MGNAKCILQQLFNYLILYMINNVRGFSLTRILVISFGAVLAFQRKQIQCKTFQFYQTTLD